MPEAKHDTDRSSGPRVRLRRPLLLALLVAGAVALMAAVSAQGAPAPAPWIVFAATPAGAAPPVNQLFRVQTSGQGLGQLTTGSLPSTAPAFSPDGKQIAFARGGAGIFGFNLDGTGLRRLTTDARDSFPTWSPDGKQIAFLRPFKLEWRIYVMSASGTGLHRLPKAPPAGRATWTADGLLLSTGGDLVEIDATTGKIKKYFNAEIDAVWGLSSVAVSPDSSTVIFMGSRRADPGDTDCGEGPCQRYALYIEDVLTSKSPRKLAADVGPGAFAPDGKSVVYAAQGGLVIRSLALGATRKISIGQASISVAAPPAWQPR